MAREKDEGGAVWWTPWWVVVVVALVAVSVTSPARAETDDGQDSSNRTTTNSTGVQGNTTEIGADTGELPGKLERRGRGRWRGVGGMKEVWGGRGRGGGGGGCPVKRGSGMFDCMLICYSRRCSYM